MEYCKFEATLRLCPCCSRITELESELTRTKEICEMLLKGLHDAECVCTMKATCVTCEALQKYEAWKKGESNGK